MLPPQKRIGIIGGGQLGKMLAEAGSPWNVKYTFLDVAGSPCTLLGGKFIEGKITSEEDIVKLAEEADVITYEIEHINTDILFELEKQGKEIYPKPSVLEIIKDKSTQKDFLSKHGINVSAYYSLKNEEDWKEKVSLFSGEKIVVKARRGGYDGKGVVILNKTQLLNGEKPFDTENTLFEEYIENALEISVIVAVDRKGNVVSFPPVTMEFDPISNLVLFLHTETGLKETIENSCREVAEKAVLAFRSPGLFAVELFVKNEEVLVNEIAPRPHNSGHHTIEACFTSQYEQLNRILLGLPLGKTELICPAAMINLVGSKEVEGKYKLSGLTSAFSEEGIYVHLYGKEESRPDRKMGHITVLASDKEALFKKVQIAKAIKITEKG